MEENKDFSGQKEFDVVAKVVDILLNDQDGSIKKKYQQLMSRRDKLDQAIKLISENRYNEFNDIIYAIEPVERHLSQLQQFVQELKKK